jgi:NAD(P)-dependent dehydrogenase (short-subunit alcohol dehydrogenase family)
MTGKDLSGRVAIVTGGTQGMGLAIAKLLAAKGARVAVGARRVADPAVAAAARDALGPGAFVGVLDVADADGVSGFVNQAREVLGPVDILVNAAGISVHQTVEGHSDADWCSVIDINLSGAFRVIRACLPEMKARGRGRIVNIASTAARVGEEYHPAYCASKAGLVGLTKAVAKEGAPHGVTCVAVSPGWVETDMLRESAKLQAARAGHSYEEELAILAAANPQNRLVQPEEVAAVVAFCCGDSAPALTMEDIQVNAGALW